MSRFDLYSRIYLGELLWLPLVAPWQKYTGLVIMGSLVSLVIRIGIEQVVGSFKNAVGKSYKGLRVEIMEGDTPYFSRTANRNSHNNANGFFYI